MTEPLSADRMKASLETLFALMLPRLAYYVQWEGIVLLATPPVPTPAFAAALFQGPATFLSPGTVNVQLTDADAIEVFGTDLSTIPIAIWADASGFVSEPTIGSHVRVGFVNADPSKPYIAGLDPLALPKLGLGVVLRAMAAAGLPTANPAVAAAIGAFG